VAGDPINSQVFYFGAVAGGIWKTVDGGTYWENVSDGFLNSAAVGALTVAPSDNNVIYAGMGESTIRIDVSFGDGIYKSTMQEKHGKTSDSRTLDMSAKFVSIRKIRICFMSLPLVMHLGQTKIEEFIVQ